ncbi:hypothetical protein D1BOALGB6SA_5932 [Olavius sp. associated proteobacterium Delta 1]|nr:hypothetical protein D1BOALGB6SA_5932 [Olavius sp. associated proteobacterium Delta 1]
MYFIIFLRAILFKPLLKNTTKLKYKYFSDISINLGLCL